VSNNSHEAANSSLKTNFCTCHSCVQCAPDPFRVAGGDSPKEWVESALDVCMDTGKEMECVDTSALSDDDGNAGDGSGPVDDDEDDDGQAEGGNGKTNDASSTSASAAGTSDVASNTGATTTPTGEPSSAVPTTMTSSGSGISNATDTMEDDVSSTDSLSGSASATDGTGFDDEDMFGSSARTITQVQHVIGLTVVAATFLGMLCSW
jgi:hypothetical protein